MRSAAMSDDAAYLLGQAKRCRDLATGVSDERIRQTLRQMADDFDRRAAELAAKPSPPNQELPFIDTDS